MAVLYIGLCRGGPAAQVRHLQWSLPRRQRTPSCSTMCSVHSSMALSARSVRHLRLISIISRQSHVSGEVSLQQVMVRWNPWLTIKARNWTNCENCWNFKSLKRNSTRWLPRGMEPLSRRTHQQRLLQPVFLRLLKPARTSANLRITWLQHA